MAQCYQKGAPSCELGVWVQDGCVALSKDAEGFWGVGFAQGLTATEAYSPAQQNAQMDCRNYSQSGNCFNLTTMCSFY